jgi:hypothetical protein
MEFAENMALTTVSYIIIRILQTFDFEAAVSPESQNPERNPNLWPSEETRYDMNDGETTYKIGVTMAPRDGVWMKLRPLVVAASQT